MARLNVVGSGPVALAFALFAARQGFARGDIDLAVAGTPPPEVGRRVLAISLGSWQLLSRVASLPRAAAIGTVDVSVLGHPGRTRITAREMKAPALGYVLRYSDLLAALDAAARAAGLGRAEPDPIAPPGVTVHAEGDTGEDAQVREFEQAALLAEVAVSDVRGGVAYECFGAAGPLAMLPLPEPRRYGLVWCATPAESRRRAALDAPALSAELQAAFGWSLGTLEVVGDAFAWPMSRRARRVLVERDEVWIGNAAQVLHPVGGQGLNLGLRDAFLLAQVLGEAKAARRSLELALETYLKRRRLDRGGTIALTDTLARAFGIAPLRPLQSAAIAALDAAAPLRAGIARQFMFGVR
ncbi:MAG: FAD-dependent monooxygenase [Burkholderiaceae bacterium]